MAIKRAAPKRKAPPPPEEKDEPIADDESDDAKEEDALPEDDNDYDDDAMEDENEAPVTPAKRKTDTKNKETPPAKKAKSDGKGFVLFVGNLNKEKDSDETESSIRNFFSNEGLEIQDVRLALSKNFAYVDFASQEEIKEALKLNGRDLLGQQVKLDRARRKEKTLQQQKAAFIPTTLLVNNLPYSTTEDTLRKIFAKVVSVRIPQKKNDKSMGYAYVEFENVEDAIDAKKTNKNTEIEGRRIKIEYSYTGKERESQKASGKSGFSSNIVFINNMTFNVQEESLQNVFEKAVAVRIPLNKGQAQKYAFLEFENVNDANESMKICKDTRIESKGIKLELIQNKKEFRPRGGNAEPTKSLIVKGLSGETTDQTLKDVFEGAVSARIIKDRDTGSSKGFGFVDFNSEEDCKAAKETLDYCEINGSSVILEYAHPKPEAKEKSGLGGRGAKRGGGSSGGGGGQGGLKE